MVPNLAVRNYAFEHGPCLTFSFQPCGKSAFSECTRPSHVSHCLHPEAGLRRRKLPRGPGLSACLPVGSGGVGSKWERSGGNLVSHTFLVPYIHTHTHTHTHTHNTMDISIYLSI
jgi:hypothetical protein